MRSKNELLALLISLGTNQPEYERLPVTFIQQCFWYYTFNHNGYGLALLTLFVTIANWGAELSAEEVVDPAERDWNGVRAGSGKHLRDGSRFAPYGGLGIAHFDSSALIDIYERWGWPKGIPKSYLRKTHFNAILKSKYRDAWLDWSTPLVLSFDFQVWSINYWVAKFWDPVWRKIVQAHKDKLDGKKVTGQMWFDMMVSCVDSSNDLLRFKNSAKYEADKYIGEPAEVIAEKYIEYKLERRGEDSAERTKRQLQFASRVDRLFDKFNIKPADII